MSGMVQELGLDYFRTRFSGAFFLDDEENVCIIDSDRRITDRRDEANDRYDGYNIPVTKLGGTAEKPTVEPIVMPSAWFDGMHRFAYPQLGYREAANGKVLVNFSRNNRSYQRGISKQNLVRDTAIHTAYMYDTGNVSSEYYTRPSTTALLIFKPTFTSLADGLAKMNEEQIMSFVLSPNLAVVHNLQEDSDNYNILFRGRHIGHLERDGSMNFLIPFNTALMEA